MGGKIARNNRREMNNPLQAPVNNPNRSEKPQEGGLSKLFQARQAQYTPVLKSLEQIGLEPKLMQVMIGDQSVDCFVIPTQDLVYKEWQHMTQAKYAPGGTSE